MDAAHKALLADRSVQFSLTPPDPEPVLPEWLRVVFRWIADVLEPIGQLVSWLGSFLPDAAYAQILLWTVVAAAAVVLVLALYHRIRHGEWALKLPRLGTTEDFSSEEEWIPEEGPALSWLEEADALARERRYAEAIHHLLFRSVEDIAKRGPNLVRPALTSRELAASAAIPGRVREQFAKIARLVEHSIFGGRNVGQKDWIEARASYSKLALAGTWRG